jgi:hypothetical protein
MAGQVARMADKIHVYGICGSGTKRSRIFNLYISRYEHLGASHGICPPYLMISFKLLN